MSGKIIDLLIFIPLIPALPVLATWFLPWERWIFKKVPNTILGPYLLYCSFAAWHFYGPWWVAILLAVAGIVVSTKAVYRHRRLKQAQHWPVAEASVVNVGESRDEDGSLNLTVTYTYKVQDERYGGSESVAFEKEEDGVRFKDECKERVKVRYRPDKPHISVLARESMR